MARLAAPAHRRADFVEEKRFAALTGVLRSTGTLAYDRPAHLEKHTIEPVAERLTVDGDRLVIDTGDAPRVVDLGSQPAIGTLVDTIRGALSGDLALLRRSYRIAGTGTLDDWRLTLDPTGPATAALVRQVVITGGQDVRSIESVQPDGDTDRLTMTAIP